MNDVPEVAAMSKEWKDNFKYFENWVAPELTKANREDEFACLGRDVVHAMATHVHADLTALVFAAGA